MKIRKVVANSRRRAFEVHAGSRKLLFPYSRLDVRPSADDRLSRVFVDAELGREAFTYVLESGAEGTVHIDHVLEYNEDPDYLRDLRIRRRTPLIRPRARRAS